MEKIDKISRKSGEANIYLNSPLVEVVCEIRFPGEMSLECKRDAFFSEIRNRYPKIYVPKSSEGKAMPLEPYRFQSEDDLAGVGLAINSLSYYEKRYKGHTKFINEFMRLAKLLEKVATLKKLTRVGWRYVNIIPFAREDEDLPLDNFLSTSIEIPKGSKIHFENINLVLASKSKLGSIVTRLQTALSEDGREAFLLDFDFSMKQDLTFSKVRTYLKTAHQETSNLFEDIITNEYREYLKGDIS